MQSTSRAIPKEISSQRLLLRCPVSGDGRLLYEAVKESLEILRAWPASLPWAKYSPSIEASEKYCHQSKVDFANQSAFAFLAFLPDGKFVGSFALHHVDWSVPKMELGFWLRCSLQRQGYATEAISALLEFAFAQLQVRRIEVKTDEDNYPCRATCLAAGLQLEGILRNDRATGSGEVKNTALYATVGD